MKICYVCGQRIERSSNDWETVKEGGTWVDVHTPYCKDALFVAGQQKGAEE